MIRLGNYEFDFACASGALGFFGRGWWWERPLFWTGHIDPREFLVITKTLSRHERKGNLSPWRPWRCVRLIEGGAVNAVGLTNVGFAEWFRRAITAGLRYNTVVSIFPENEDEARFMANNVMVLSHVKGCYSVRGVEVNVSCPNVEHSQAIDHVVRIVKAAQRPGLPVLVKMGWHQPFADICKALDGQVAAFDLINCVPWPLLGNAPSPLAKYGLEGGVSGQRIQWQSFEAMRRIKAAGIRTPILSGGGVMGIDDVRERFRLGAGAVAFGTMFLRRPWAPRQVIRQWRAENANQPGGAQPRPA